MSKFTENNYFVKRNSGVIDISFASLHFDPNRGCGDGLWWGWRICAKVFHCGSLLCQSCDCGALFACLNLISYLKKNEFSFFF